MVSYECVEHIMQKKTGKMSNMAIKLDMSKTYDRVEWHFLEQAMLKISFSTNWVSIVMNCISTISFSIMINGQAKGFFKPQRTLRQGDPLSPYLFLLCAESLSHMLTTALRQGNISGCQISSSCPKISHLFFCR